MSYQDAKTAQNYIDFLGSANGRVQQDILAAAILAKLPASTECVLLDAACGTGWLAAKLKEKYTGVYACDSSASLIAHGRQRYPAVEFSHCDILTQLPYPNGFFDIAILNMAGPDMADLPSSIQNLTGKIKMGGRLIMTMPNPFYTYPVAVWKRNLIDVLLRRKPRLKISEAYFGPKKIEREFNGKKIISNFYNLQNYLDAAKLAGLELAAITELKSQTDSKEFGLQYQMYRYPLILMVEFNK